MTKHTGTPWQADECEDAQGFITIRRRSDDSNGDTEHQPIATVFKLEDADMIVKATNNHDALMAALKRFCTAAFGRETVMGDPSSYLDSKAELDAARKQAEELIARIETA